MGRSEKKIAPYGFSGNSLVTWKFMGRSEKKIAPYGFGGNSPVGADPLFRSARCFRGSPLF